MSATVPFQTQLTVKQITQLARQLPADEKRRLARLLEKEASVETNASFDESQLTPLQRKTVANIRQGFKELKLIREGKLQARPLSDLLDEL
jgi:hypothetical protein